MISSPSPPLARGPLLGWHRRAGGRVEAVAGWEICTSHPGTADVSLASDNLLLDWSHRSVIELSGPRTGELVRGLVGSDVAVRRMGAGQAGIVCRLTPGRAIVIGDVGPEVLGDPAAVDVTGGWATIVLAGPDAVNILSMLGHADLRTRAMPVAACRQGPIAGINTLLCHFAGHWELHACPDSAVSLWEAVLDEGRAYRLRVVGAERLGEVVTVGGGGPEESS
jgi:glycine cleavage system aminomethyltransferase T